MINIENEIFNRVATSVSNEYPNAGVSGEYVKMPSVFPHISIVEMDNLAYIKTQSSDSGENHVSVMYEVNVYSNLTNGKKTECKNIIALIDAEMIAMGFNRTMLQPILNMDDATIYRMVARYTAVVSQNKTIFRR